LTTQAFQVSLVAATEMPQRVAYIALHTDYAEEFSPATDLTEDRCGEIVVERLLKGNRGHYGPLEHPSMTLAIKADHNTIVQLRTHRIGMSFDVQSMRYTGNRVIQVAKRELPVESVFYVRSPGTYWDRQGDRYEWTADDQEEALAIAFSSAIDYARLRDAGVSEEHARQQLITSYFQNAVITGNLRSWLHLLDVRLKSDAQLEIKNLMESVAREVQRWAPEVYAWWATNRKGKAQLAP
jgi:thymidylate synthase (FAD)